jgi:hypothetical protein
MIDFIQKIYLLAPQNMTSSTHIEDGRKKQSLLFDLTLIIILITYYCQESNLKEKKFMCLLAQSLFQKSKKISTGGKKDSSDQNDTVYVK